MDPNTYRNEPDADDNEAYWRRRAITLAAGLGLLGMLAWAFSGGGGKPASVSPLPTGSQVSGLTPAAAYSGSSASGGAGQANGGNGPGAGLAGAPASGLAASPASPGARGTPSAGQSGTSAPGGTHGPSGPSGSGGTQGPSGPSGSGGRCAPRALVLSLFTSRSSYRGGQYPAFDVYAVSTAAGRCALDLGPGKLQVVVMSAGRVIWDSADCARGVPDRVAELSRGVPAQESVVWNRAVTLPGCVTLASARPGTYQVQARTGAVSSPVRRFRLVR
jgi:hypothetical protein